MDNAGAARADSRISTYPPAMRTRMAIRMRRKFSSCFFCLAADQVDDLRAQRQQLNLSFEIYAGFATGSVAPDLRACEAAIDILGGPRLRELGVQLHASLREREDRR
jgi:hypothetical protein